MHAVDENVTIKTVTWGCVEWCSHNNHCKSSMHVRPWALHLLIWS